VSGLRPAPAAGLAFLLVALHTVTLASGVPAGLPEESATIVTADGGSHDFRLHVARTPEHRRRGLMFVTRLDADEGMLFDFEVPRSVGMWMKNTPLSLDMLFVRADGRIANIATHTRPFSKRMISSHGDVLAVIELPAGTTARLRIRDGDRVEHPIFAEPGS
jgi:uncharacterized membrane protein (UPF0127 family)